MIKHSSSRSDYRDGMVAEQKSDAAELNLFRGSVSASRGGSGSIRETSSAHSTHQINGAKSSLLCPMGTWAKLQQQAA